MMKANSGLDVKILRHPSPRSSKWHDGHISEAPYDD